MIQPKELSKNLTPEQLRENVAELISSIHTITGHKLPVKEHRLMLVDVIERAILKYFSAHTFNDFIDIFSEHAASVENFGKPINLNFFYNVMRAFTNSKREQQYQSERS